MHKITAYLLLEGARIYVMYVWVEAEVCMDGDPTSIASLFRCAGFDWRNASATFYTRTLHLHHHRQPIKPAKSVLAAIFDSTFAMAEL